MNGKQPVAMTIKYVSIMYISLQTSSNSSASQFGLSNCPLLNHVLYT